MRLNFLISLLVSLGLHGTIIILPLWIESLPPSALQNLRIIERIKHKAASMAEDLSSPYSKKELHQMASQAFLSKRNEKPIYPPLALKLKQEGLVKIEVKVSPEGTVDQLVFKESSGSFSLDQAIIKTVKKWVVLNPKKKSFWLTLPSFHFKLKKDS